jgi:adenylate cyclase
LKLNPRWNLKLSIQGVVRVALGLLIVFAFIVNEAEWAQARFIQQLELLTYDARLRFFMPKTMDPRIVILDIDEKSLNAEGRWPWSRNKVAEMVRQLFERYKVKVVGFDVAFAEPDPSSGLASLDAIAKGDLKDNSEYQAWLAKSRAGLDYDAVFAEELKKHPVVLGFFLGGKTDKAGVLPPPVLDVKSLPATQFRHHFATGYSGNIKTLQDAATAAGHLYPALDFDGTTRRVPMFMRFEDGYYEAMSLAVARTYFSNAPLKIRTHTEGAGNRAVGWLREVQVGDIKIPIDDAMTALVPYRGASGVFRYVSATDVIRGTLPADELRDKIIIVGTSAQGLLDLRATPVREDFPGVEIHANLVSGFLDQTIKHRPAEVTAIAVLTILLLGVPFAVLMPRMSAMVATGVVIGLTALTVAYNLYQWKANNYVVPFAAPLLMLTLLYFMNMAWGFFTEARSRRLITGLFGTYVPKELVAEMSKNPEEYSMRGESREMTVLFSDVRNFTTISEGLTPEGLKDLMNTYLTEMTEEIQQRRGTIDKYIGDAIMAFWGAPLNDPEHAKHGLETAIAMQKSIRKLDPEFAKRGWPALHIGVGLNCGVMSVGDMGSKFRRAYTVLGDAVNLASRLEGLTKEYGVQILVTGNIVDSAQGFIYREVDKVRVKGKLEGVAIFEPVGRIGEVPETTVQEVDRFHKALEHYRKSRWDECERLLKDLAYANPEVKLYKLYLERVAHFRASPPPADWDGVFTFTTK